MALRILFLGENWFGSCARACCYALRRMNCDVSDVDIQTVFPQLRQLSSRVICRLFKGRFVHEYNDLILDRAEAFKPHMLLAFKGTYVTAETLRVLREKSIALYNYYPDRVAVSPGGKTLAEYDCMFDTKRFLDGEWGEHVKLRNRVFLPHGYDRDVHLPLELDNEEQGIYKADVSFIATHSPFKEAKLRNLIAMRPGIDLKIWGSGWDEHCRSSVLRKHVFGGALFGSQYAKAIRAARINLGVMGVSEAAKDETSTRTYEIPACGGFMLHERTEEVLSVYRENEEIACFGSIEELAEKIDFYLAHPEERTGIARAGHKRCVPAYSYDNRMAELIRWHREHWSSLKRTESISK